jgi:hypothetical protein
VTVKDPVALSKLCCDCFGLIEREYRRHLRSADPGHRRPDASAASAPTAALPRSKVAGSRARPWCRLKRDEVRFDHRGTFTSPEGRGRIAS